MSSELKTESKTEWKKDWRKIARASGFTIPDAALEPISQSLYALQAGFRPLARDLPPETEPAVAFQAAHEAGE